MALISSSYPALFLTTFNPVEAIKGKSKAGREGKSFRNVLVVFQFSVSIILIICTAIVFQQLKYVSEKDLGFDRENLLVLRHVEHANNRVNLAHDAENIPGAISTTWCASAPPYIYGGDSFSAEGQSDLKFPLNYTGGDENYIPTLGIRVKFGRNFDAGIPADSNRVILNESAVRRIGWKLDESVIGKKLSYPNSGVDATFEVIGVVADFNYWSLDGPIGPLGIFNMKNKMIEDDGDDLGNSLGMHLHGRRLDQEAMQVGKTR